MLCPVCGRQYEAGTRFCTDDGTPLVAAPAGPPPSASGELDRLLTEAPAVPYAPPVPTVAAHAVAAPARTGGLVAVVAVLGVLVVGMLAVVMWQQKQTADAAAVRAAEADARAAEAQRTAEAATTAADAALQARHAAERAPMQSAEGDVGDGTTVWANSPNDGFLALRSGPTTAGGTRLLKIPHGDPLTLGDCTLPTTSPGGRSGSWCRAVYGGTAGWVFDAFVTR